MGPFWVESLGDRYPVAVSTGKRAYDLLRAYVGSEWDRIRGVEETFAEQELNQAMQDPAPAPAEPRPVLATPTPDNMARARQILGVSNSASFADVRQAFERLNKRSSPQNFPPGSTEAGQAAEIQKLVHWAYAVLSDNVDSTERRFRSLEIE